MKRLAYIVIAVEIDATRDPDTPRRPGHRPLRQALEFACADALRYKGGVYAETAVVLVTTHDLPDDNPARHAPPSTPRAPSCLTPPFSS